MLISIRYNKLLYGNGLYCLNNNFMCKSFIHSSMFLNSDADRNNSNTLNEILDRSEYSDMNKALIKYVDEGAFNDVKEGLVNNVSNLEESFPWLVDDEGRPLNFNRSINLFEGIKLVSRYMEKRYGVDSINDLKISEIIKPFMEENNKVRIIDLYNHISKIYNEDKENLINKLLMNTGEVVNKDNINDLKKIFKPLGDFGDISLNDIANSLKDLKWEVLLNRTEITLNALPIAMNTIGFGLVMRSYIKLVHNRPYNPNLDDYGRMLERTLRNKHLLGFAVLGAPFVILSLKNSSLLFKDMLTVNVNLGNEAQMDISNNIYNGSLLSIFTSLKNKIPQWVKFLFGYILIVCFVLRLLGFDSVIGFFNDMYYLKIYIYVVGILILIYFMVELLILYLFMTKKIKISEILPEFIIDWLKTIEHFSTNTERIKIFKDLIFREMLLYIIILIILTIL